MKEKGVATDVLSPEQRHLCMSRNQGRDTGPEVRLRKRCFALGLRFRLNSKLPGRPDFVFVRARVAVFVDGCFWHGCPLHYKAPSTRKEFWSEKISKNRQRDKAVNAELHRSGWMVFRVWEHEVRTNVDLTAMAIKSAVTSRIQPSSVKASKD